MDLPLVRKKFLISLTISGVIVGILGKLFYEYYCPEIYSPYFPLIPLFFYVFGVVFIYLFEYLHRYMAHRSLMEYVISKGAKLVMALFFLVVYGLFIKIHTKAYILTFLIYYLFYVVFESYFFLRFEIEMKKENKKK